MKYLKAVWEFCRYVFVPQRRPTDGSRGHGMKRQNGISKMKSINMGEQYFKGVLAGYLGANFMCGPITEWQIDIIKENISHYCEATIDHSQLSYQEKEDQKRQMKQSLEVYIQGVKDEMRGMGRMK